MTIPDDSNVISFFTVVIPVTLVLFCLLVVDDLVQDTAIQMKGSSTVLGGSSSLFIFT